MKHSNTWVVLGAGLAVSVFLVTGCNRSDPYTSDIDEQKPVEVEPLPEIYNSSGEPLTTDGVKTPWDNEEEKRDKDKRQEDYVKNTIENAGASTDVAGSQYDEEQIRCFTELQGLIYEDLGANSNISDITDKTTNCEGVVVNADIYNGWLDSLQNTN